MELAVPFRSHQNKSIASISHMGQANLVSPGLQSQSHGRDGCLEGPQQRNTAEVSQNSLEPVSDVQGDAKDCAVRASSGDDAQATCQTKTGIPLTCKPASYVQED